MKKTDLAYAAGIIDGEGCIGIYCHNRTNGRDYFRLHVVVSSTDEWLCRWLAFAFGGWVKEKEKVSRLNHQLCYQWGLNNRGALLFLKDILPYLKLKRPQADIAIQYQEKKRGLGGKKLTEEERAVIEAQVIMLKKLKHRVEQKYEVIS